MFDGKKILFALVAAALATPVFHDVAYSDALSLLDEQEQGAWHAVGRVNGAGYVKQNGCTGTLIAPDLVVTAAHCVFGNGKVAPLRYFVAGWHRGRFAAQRVSEEIAVHPLYSLVEGAKKFHFDVAVMRLADPIPRGLVAPMDLVGSDAPAPPEALLLGYQNRRPSALSGQDECQRLAGDAGQWFIFGCKVVGGTSGGAAVVITETGPALAGVIVASSGSAGHALVVPISQWLQDAWKTAMIREEKRP